MLALAARMNLEGDFVLRALAACPQTGGHEPRANITDPNVRVMHNQEGYVAWQT